MQPFFGSAHDAAPEGHDGLRLERNNVGPKVRINLVQDRLRGEYLPRLCFCEAFIILCFTYV
jgi:hypothetical protein